MCFVNSGVKVKLNKELQVKTRFIVAATGKVESAQIIHPLEDSPQFKKLKKCMIDQILA